MGESIKNVSQLARISAQISGNAEQSSGVNSEFPKQSSGAMNRYNLLKRIRFRLATTPHILQ
jgi:hypothetical protein